MTPDEIRRNIDGFTDRDLLIEIYTRVENMGEHIEHLDKQIHGNGQAGLKDRVSKLEERTRPDAKLLAGSGVVGAVAVAIFDKIFGILPK